MKKRTQRILFRLVMPTVLALLAVISFVWGYTQRAKAVTYQRQLSNVYQRSFYDLIDNMSLIEASLSKVIVVTTAEQYTLLLSEIWMLADESAMLLGQAPVSYSGYSELLKYLTQLGDYCRVLMKSVLDENAVTEEQLKTLAQLHETSVDLNDQLLDAQASGNIVFQSSDVPETVYNQEADEEFSFIEEEAKNRYPQLIYDGPFSDSVARAEPVGLSEQIYDESAAKEVAKIYLGAELDGELQHTEDVTGRIETYGFTGKAYDGRVIEIHVTKRGGQVLWMRVNEEQKTLGETFTQKEAITMEEALVPSDERVAELKIIGQQFLADHDFPSMEPTYAEYYGGNAVINYVFVQNGVCIYNDLIKVWVETESGRVIASDATNFLNSHTQRNIGESKLTPEEAQDLLSPVLNVLRVRRALIPISINEERFCYEFTCTYESDSYIVYLNVETGAEEQVFKIINSKLGQLVI